MSKTVDTKVVEMKFDNKKFEKNAKQTMSTLDKLKEKLKFEKIGEGIDKIKDSFKNFSVEKTNKELDTTEEKVNRLDVAIKNAFSFSVIQRFTNGLITAGERLVKSLSIDQITSGWDKYVNKASSVQTLMNATGKSVDEVNEYLDKLQWFADETSYDFTTMASSLGQLVTSGGEVAKLIPMLEGIANATAFAGKGTQEFSRAVYNLNQSYGAGYLQYMDWRSLELAGIASEQLKQTFIDQAKALGKLDKNGKTVKGTLVDIGNFSQTLSEKWATTEVIEATFGQFAKYTEEAYEMINVLGTAENATDAYEQLGKLYDDIFIKSAKAAQEVKSFNDAVGAVKDATSSQWSQIFEGIFGNYEEGKSVWGEIYEELYDIFVPGIERWRDIIKLWSDANSGGRETLWEGIRRFWENIKEIVNAVRAGFEDIFPKKDVNEAASSLLLLTNNFRNLAYRLKPSVRLLEVLRSVARSVAAVFKLFSTIISGIVKGLFPALKTGVKGVGIVAGETGKTFADWVTSLTTFIEQSKIFEQIFAKIGSILSKVVNAGVSAYEWIKSLFLKINITDKLQDVNRQTNESQKNVYKLGDGFKTLFSIVNKGINTFVASVKKIWASIGAIFTTVKNWFGKKLFGIQNEELEETVEVVDEVGEAALETAAKVEEFLNKIETIIDKILNSRIVVFVKNVGNAILNVIENTIKTFDNLTGAVEKFTKAASIEDYMALFKDFARQGILLSIADLLSGIGTAFKGIKDAGSAIKNISKLLDGIKDSILKWKDSGVTKTYIESIAKSILMLTASLLVLAWLGEGDKMVDAIKGLAALTALLGGVFTLMTVLSRWLGKIDAAGSAFSLFETGSDGLKTFFKVNTGFIADIAKTASIFTGIGLALIELAIAMKIISGIDPNVMWKSFGVLTAILGVLVAGSAAIIGLSVLAKDAIKTVAKQFTLLGFALTGFAFGVLAVVGSMWAISKIVDNSFWPTFLIFVTIFGTFVAALGILTIVSTNTSFAFKLLNTANNALLDIQRSTNVSVLRVAAAMLILSASIGLFALNTLALVGAIKLMSMIDLEGCDSAISVVVITLASLLVSFSIMSFVSNKLISPAISTAFSMILVSASIGIFAAGCLALVGAIKLIDTMDLSECETTISMVVVTFAALLASFVLLSFVADKMLSSMISIAASMTLIGASMITFALGFVVLAGAIALLSLIEPNVVITSLIGFAGLLIVIIGMTSLLGRIVGNTKSGGIKVGMTLLLMAASFVLMSAAMVIIASAIALMAANTDSVALFGEVLGLFAIFGTMIILFAKVVKQSRVYVNEAAKSMITMGIGIILMSASLLVIASAIILMNEASNSVALMREIVGIFAVFLGSAILMATLTSKSTVSVLKGAASMVILGAAMLVFALSFIGMAFAVIMMGDVANAVDIIGTFGLIIGIVSGIAGVIAAIGAFTGGAGSASIVAIMFALAGAMLLLSLSAAVFAVSAIGVASAIFLLAQALVMLAGNGPSILGVLEQLLPTLSLFMLSFSVSILIAGAAFTVFGAGAAFATSAIIPLIGMIAAAISVLSLLSGSTKKAGINAGNAFIAGIRNPLEIHSPSGAMELIGKYITAGLQNGLKGIGKTGEKAGDTFIGAFTGSATDIQASGIGESLKSAFADLGSSAGDTFLKEFGLEDITKLFSDTEMDGPVAKVRLDTSEVTSGMADLSSLLGENDYTSYVNSIGGSGRIGNVTMNIYGNDLSAEEIADEVMERLGDVVSSTNAVYR